MNKNYLSLIREQSKLAKKDLIVELNPNDPSLSEQLTLGDNWNDPKAVTEAVDMHPMFYARWLTKKRYVRNAASQNWLDMMAEVPIHLIIR